MSSPLTALGFAALITVSLGSMAAKVAPTLSPLPIFALILVSKHVVALSVRVCIACVALIYLNSHNWFIQQNAYVLCTNYQQFWLCSVFPQSTKLDGKKTFCSLNGPFDRIQGVHTMLPISWPVSVVLAVILSIIHFGLRIALNTDDYPELFAQTVSFNFHVFDQIPTHL